MLKKTNYNANYLKGNVFMLSFIYLNGSNFKCIFYKKNAIIFWQTYKAYMLYRFKYYFYIEI